MTEERITETTTPSGNTHTTHTVVSDDGAGKGGANWVMILLVVLALVIGGYFLMQQTGAEVAKDNAIAGAAEEVGEAAGQIGEAAENVGDAAQDAVEN